MASSTRRSKDSLASRGDSVQSDVQLEDNSVQSTDVQLTNDSIQSDVQIANDSLQSDVQLDRHAVQSVCSSVEVAARAPGCDDHSTTRPDSPAPSQISTPPACSKPRPRTLLVTSLTAGACLAYVAYCLSVGGVEDRANIVLLVGVGLGVLVGAWRLGGGAVGGAARAAVRRSRGRHERGWHWALRVSKWGTWLALTLVLGVFAVTSCVREPRNACALLGLATLVGLCAAASRAPSKIAWRTVLAGLGVQLTMGLLVMRWQGANDAVAWVARLVTSFLEFGLIGAEFVFGESLWDHAFAMAILPILCFFMAVTTLLYHVGALQRFVGAVGRALAWTLDTSHAEAFVAVADVFLGPDAAIIMISSMVPAMTTSQLHTLFCCGLATIDAGMLPLYESIGVSAQHMVSASLMSAPAAVVFSKLLIPETPAACGGEISGGETSDGMARGGVAREGETRRQTVVFEKSPYSSAAHALVCGAVSAVPIIAQILVMLVAFVALLAAVNAGLAWAGDRVGLDDLSLEGILSYPFMPLTDRLVQGILSYPFMPLSFLMGVAWEDCREVARLVSLKSVVNEFVAYMELSELINNRLNGTSPSISVRSETIATYALCGYSNIGTVGFVVGLLCSLAPTRTAWVVTDRLVACGAGDISSMAVRALVGGSFACFATACTAGLFYAE